MAYSLDFSECVIRNIDNGMTWDNAVGVFSITRATIAKWYNNLKTHGNLGDLPRKEYKPKKINPALLIEAINQNPDATLEELGEQFGCWGQSIHKRCVKLGITHKKTTLYPEQNEEKRQAFNAEIATITPDDIVYIDETVIDSSLQREYA